MASFFNQVKDKLAQVGQGAVKGTKDFTETARLNSQIADVARLQDDLFRQIGEKYFELYPNSADAHFSGLCAELRESMDKEDNLLRQIALIKGKVICEGCGSEMPADAIFCSVCGIKIVLPTAEPEQQSAAVCTKCGSPLNEGEDFCTKCAAPVGASSEIAEPPGAKPAAADEVAATVTVEPVSEAAAEQEAPKPRRCPHCGAEVEDNTFFCTSCGSKVS